MDTLTQGSLKQLAAREADVCVSIYLPLERTYPQTNENPRRLAAALDEAVEMLCTQHGVSNAAAEKLVSGGRELVGQREFWQASDADGLAVLCASNKTKDPETKTYRLPYSVSTSVDVGNRFHLTPLVQLLESGLEFQLLALGLKHIRLYSGNRKSLTQIPLPPGVPESFDAYMAGTDVGQPIQSRTSAAGGSGSQVQTIHGPNYKDDHKMRVKEFVSHIGKRIAAHTKDSGLPLVLAAIESYKPAFRDACRLENLITEGVSGSPDELSDQELHQQAVRAVEVWNAQRLASFQGVYQTRLTHGRASDRLEVIVPAAQQGRVENLVITGNTRAWGEWDARNNVASCHQERLPLDVDLLDLAVRETLCHGGAVHSASTKSLVENSPAAAVLRW